MSPPGPMAKEMPGGRYDDRRVAAGTSDERSPSCLWPVRCFSLSSSVWVYMMDTGRATKKGLDRFVEPLKDLVGMRGFEPPTTCTPCRYASQAALHPESKSHCTVLSSEGQGFCAGKRRSVLTRGSQRGAIPMLPIPDGVFFSREANECVFETIGKASVFHSDQWSLL